MIYPEAVFLDFDGVVCESCQIKNAAYYNSYAEFGADIAQRALDYHLLHGGVSRVKLFPILHRMLLGREITPEEHKMMSERFTSWVEQEVVKAPLTEGVEDFLKSCQGRCRVYVSSGTPQDEMRRIVEAKGIGKYFDGVFGSPDTKDMHIRAILDKFSIKNSNALFVGDATTDRDAAKTTGIRFIARLSEDSILHDEKFKIENFTQIYSLIEEMWQ
ncbi:MAG: HAD hydrolase-like protein [Bacteroidales bacterium]|nr:HAD hydrolase-like protein [Bacteroidales bacterium]